jgi:hypothetical protein
MATDPPELDPPTTRARLIDAFGPISSWGEHSPAAMQALLDALDAETVAAVDSLDDLENVENSDIPYVIKGDDTAPGDLSDQAIPTGKQLKALSNSVSNQVQSVNAQTLNSVETMADIPDHPNGGDRYFVGELGTAVQYNGDTGKFKIEGRAVTDGSGTEALPDAKRFEDGSEIKTRGDGKTWEVDSNA